MPLGCWSQPTFAAEPPAWAPDCDRKSVAGHSLPAKKTKEDPTGLEDAGGKVVKMVYRLLFDLPTGYLYRVLFMRRKMDEVLAPQKGMLARQGGGAESIADEQIAALFRKQLADFEEFISGQRNFEVIEVDYKQILEVPVSSKS